MTCFTLYFTSLQRKRQQRNKANQWVQRWGLQSGEHQEDTQERGPVDDPNPHCSDGSTALYI